MNQDKGHVHFLYDSKPGTKLKFQLSILSNEFSKVLVSPFVNDSNSSAEILIATSQQQGNYLCMKVGEKYYLVDHKSIERVVKPDLDHLIDKRFPSVTLMFGNLSILYYNDDDTTSQDTEFENLGKSVEMMMKRLEKDKISTLNFSQEYEMDLTMRYERMMSYTNGLVGCTMDSEKLIRDYAFSILDLNHLHSLRTVSVSQKEIDPDLFQAFNFGINKTVVSNKTLDDLDMKVQEIIENYKKSMIVDFLPHRKI